jgi:hypothetical protein
VREIPPDPELAIRGKQRQRTGSVREIPPDPELRLNTCAVASVAESDAHSLEKRRPCGE